MDMSFAGQTYAAKFLWERRGKLSAQVYQLPEELDQQIAQLKLEAEGVTIDRLTKEQEKYLNTWEEGT
jgi:adenosylhomocysteinase